MKTNIAYREDVLNNTTPAYRKWFADEKEYIENTITPNAKVLEIGCGTGRTIFDILSLTQDIVGIDHDPKVVQEAAANLAAYPSVKIIQADAIDLPFDNECFDLVLCMWSFVNFGDKRSTILEEMKRVLKPWGKIIISAFSETALEERMKVYESIHIKIKKIEDWIVYFDDVIDDNISEQFTREQLEEIFTSADLDIKDISKKDIAYLCTLQK